MGTKKQDSSPLASEHRLVGYADFEQLTFPSFVTAYLMYFATGEGVTRGIAMQYATSAVELRESLTRLWHEHFAVGCEATNGFTVLPGFEDLIPEHIKRILDGTNPQRRMPNLMFHTTVHENYS